MLRPALQKSRELKLPLYCGEFGCLPRRVERADRLKYYEDIVSVFEENNIAWCNWEYRRVTSEFCSSISTRKFRWPPIPD